ncbi:hypothetical protein F2Q69_00007770 [Brassica cretica]|uniref:Uncharacterized protein n=1 Tax=Brassica cretica TaxID=69181 RepID=A0A8S9P0Z0_BRACR|nr:hypothetical protein F2Q69_00007770 [Brassica cretica]
MGITSTSVQSTILYDCDAEALSRSVRPRQSVSSMIKWRYCPELVQFHGFRSVEVLLDTPPRSSKNCPEPKGSGFKETPYSLDREHSERWVHGPWLSGYTDGVVTGSDPTILGLSRGDPTVLWAAIVVKQPAVARLYWGCRAVTLLYCGPRSVESSLGKDDRIAGCWTLGPPV